MLSMRHGARDTTGPADTAADAARAGDAFRDRLAALAEVSTIGISTAEGVSPNNAALERLAWSVSDLPDASGQAAAISDLLHASNRLPPDQHAHVVATIIHDLVIPGRIALRAAAQPMVGRALMQAGLEAAPLLAPQSAAYEVLKLHLQRLANRQEYDFGDEIYDQLDEVGFNAPSLRVESDAASRQSPKHRAEWLRGRIGRLDRIDAPTLSSLVEEALALPKTFQGGPGGILTLLVNTLAAMERDARAGQAGDALWAAAAALPPALRITALEAYYNQMNLMPREAAEAMHEQVLRSVQALPERIDGLPWFARSRTDLLAILRKQIKVLREAGLEPGESLAQCDERLGRGTDPNAAWLFSHMRLRSGR